MSIKWTPQNKPLAELRPNPKNPRKIGGKKLDDLKESMKRFGLADVLTVNTDGLIIGGHARYYSLVEAGETHAMCLVPDRTLTAKEVDQLGIRLNKNVAGEWDHDMLNSLFDPEELQEWGFEEFELGGFGMEDDEKEGKGDKADEADKGSDEWECECPECGLLGKKSDFLKKK